MTPHPPATVTGQRRCAFTAAPRSGQLSWAQQSMLAIVEDLQPCTETLNLTFSCLLRPGLAEEEVLAALVELVTAHEALRTVYVAAPHGPGQRVLGDGELVVQVVEAEADAGAQQAGAAADTLGSTPFDVSAELPIRVALLTRDGRPWSLAFAVFHLATDAFGIDLIRQHLLTLLAGPARPSTIESGAHHPLDEAHWQGTPAGQRHAQRAVRHHEGALRAMPQTMLPRPVREFEAPRFRYVRFASPALALAVPALAARHRVHGTAPLYAGVCAVAGFVSGLDRAGLQLNFSNRSAPRVRNAVGILTQHPPAWVDLRDASVADVIDRAGTAVVGAQRFGQYPEAELSAARREIELERGVALDLSCWLNDHRASVAGPGSGHAPGVAALAEAAGRTRWRPAGSDRASSSTYFVHVEDDGDALVLTVLHDTAVLPTAELVGWLYAVEWLLCTALNRDVGLAEIGEHTTLTPASYGAQWQHADASWVHLPTIAELVGAAAGGQRAAVFPVATAQGTRLVAYLDGTGRPVDLEALHRACVAALPGVRTAMAPHAYVACAGVPAACAGVPAACAGVPAGEPVHGDWLRMPVLAEGTGRPAVSRPAG